MIGYGGDTTVEAVEKAAWWCSRCKGKNITSTQIIYVGNGNSELAMHSAHTPKDNKNF